jgi:hypothetical protein
MRAAAVYACKQALRWLFWVADGADFGLTTAQRLSNTMLLTAASELDISVVSAQVWWLRLPPQSHEAGLGSRKPRTML